MSRGQRPARRVVEALDEFLLSRQAATPTLKTTRQQLEIINA